MKTIIQTFILYLFLLGHGLSAEEGMPQLNPEFWPSQIFWLLASFAFLYLTIWKFILPKITNNIENRKAKIVSDLNEAQKIKEDAKKKLVEYENIMNSAKINAKKIVHESKISLEKDINAKRKKFESEIENEILSVEKKMNEFKKSSSLSVEKIAEEVSTEVIKKILSSNLNSSNVSAIVKDVCSKRLREYI